MAVSSVENNGYRGETRIMESVIDSSLKERNAGNKEMDEIAFSTDRRFSRLHCEQMEIDLKNSPHGFSPERAHLAVLR